MDLSQFNEDTYPPLTMESLMPFGKYEGEQIEDLLVDQPEYLIWLRDNTDTVFDEEVSEKLSRL